MGKVAACSTAHGRPSAYRGYCCGVPFLTIITPVLLPKLTHGPPARHHHNCSSVCSLTYGSYCALRSTYGL